MAIQIAGMNRMFRAETQRADWNTKSGSGDALYVGDYVNDDIYRVSYGLH